MIKKCKNCEREFKTTRSAKQHCSDVCFSKYRRRADVLAETVLRRKESNLKKYGVDNPAKSEEVKEKTKATCIEKYGTTSPSQNLSIREKQVNSCLLRYGVKNPQQNSIIKSKQRNTLYNNFGVTSPLKSEELLNKVKSTNIARYGVDNISKLEETKTKISETNLLKYGVKFISQSDEFKRKQIATRLKSHYSYLVESSKFTNIIPLFSEEEYFGNVSYDTVYMFKCKICNSEFKSTLLNGNIPRCYICNPIKKTQSQTEVFEFIKSKFIDKEILFNDRKTLQGKELDIYIPHLNLAIEYNGLYWHSELGGRKYKNYHLNKTIECEKLGIRLIHIFEDEWIYKKDIIKGKLLHIMNKNECQKIYARQCEIRLVAASISNTFLNNTHIQGSDNSSIRLGAYYKDELVAIMTFGCLRMVLGNKSKENNWELYRFSTLADKRIVGIGGKLFKHFMNNYAPIYVVSYADSRWSINADNNLYKSIGFEFVKRTTPNYWYIGKNYNDRIYRYNFRKHILKDIFPNFDPNLTEWKNMQLNGYDRIWDCGSFKYEWKANKNVL